MDDIDRYREAVRSYPALQGLRVIPLGLVFLAFPLQWIAPSVLGPQGDCTYTLPLILLGFALWFVIGKYYERIFGKVVPLRPARGLNRGVAISLGVVIAAIIVENVLYRFRIVDLPISLIELSIGAATLNAGRATRRWYYSAVGIAFLVAGFLPLAFGVTVGDRTFGSFGVVFSILYGGSLILIGVLDHLRLIHTFHPSGGASHAGNP